MRYKIIEVHQTYQDGSPRDNKLSEIAVLWQSNERGWVRASYCTTKPCAGYKFLLPDELLSPKLIQEVAGQGMNLPEKASEE